MTEHALPDPNEPPEDVASLYSWANLHGGKYRDFSASRAEIREKTRQRTEEAIEQERLRAQQEAEAQPAAEAAPDEDVYKRQAQQELCFRILPVYPAMRAAIDWFRANGYAPANASQAGQ